MCVLYEHTYIVGANLDRAIESVARQYYILFDTSDSPPRGVRRTYERLPPQSNENKMTCLVAAKPIVSQFNQVGGKYIHIMYLYMILYYTTTNNITAAITVARIIKQR